MIGGEAEHGIRSLEIHRYDHIQGPAAAPVTLIEYGDFQCPNCGDAFAIVKQLRETLGDDLRFVYRHFSLVRIHSYAELAAEAAGAQNRFWHMHDYLFENQYAVSPDFLAKAAEDLHLDVTRYIHDLKERAYTKRVQDDLASGARAGVHGTPTFFINGVRHPGSYDFDSMIQAIRDQRRGLAA